MRAFQVSLNGKRLCVAGIGQDGVLTGIVDHVARRGRNELSLHVGGLISPTEEHVTWRNVRLKVGDIVSLKIVEADSVDSPRSRYRSGSKQAERNQKAFARAVAKKFGWKLLTRPHTSP